MLTFFLEYPHIIIFCVWVVFAILLARAYFYAPFGVHVGYARFVVAATVVHLAYATMLSWGQYIVWSGNEFTRVFLNHPIPADISFSPIISWLTPLFRGELGYFSFYVFGRFFVPLVALFLVALLFGVFLAIYKHYHPLKFKEGDTSVILASLLVSGWPGVVVLIPAALLGTLLKFLIQRNRLGVEHVYLPPLFIILAPLALLSAPYVMHFLRMIAR